MKDYIKAKEWDGNDLNGKWRVTKKIDGVRAFFTDAGVFSRNGKPLYNMQQLHKSGIRGDFEVYLGDFKSSIQATRSKNKVIKISKKNLYSLDPLDKRLDCGGAENFSKEEIQFLLESAVSAGLEGLILRQGKVWLKVKPFKSFDVPVTGILEGTGKYVGMLGAFMTPMGKVGTGFTDRQRKDLFEESYIGQTIEVKCMELTEDGLFRHPAFMRIREDK
jgi:DNA ligase-1